jgi:pyridoxamine 5'-phosphate oxidase
MERDERRPDGSPFPNQVRGLTEADLGRDPVVEFDRWLADARTAGGPLPEAMALATADSTGAPSVRHVLLRGLDERGFVFFTNYDSRKGRELAANPRAALAFHWPQLKRQVTVTGHVERVARVESERYFAARPVGHRLSAWASRQSEVLAGRGELEQRFAEAEARFAGHDVPLPANWGGFRLRPNTIEFWQGRLNRMHDRLRYTRDAEGWRPERLSP